VTKPRPNPKEKHVDSSRSTDNSSRMPRKLPDGPGQPLVAGASSFEREIAANVALDGDTRRCCNNPDCGNDYPCALHPDPRPNPPQLWLPKESTCDAKAILREPREEVMPNETSTIHRGATDETGEAHPTNTLQPDLEAELIEYAVCRRDNQDQPDCASYAGGKCDCGFMELIAKYNAARRLSPDPTLVGAEMYKMRVQGKPLAQTLNWSSPSLGSSLKPK
jgi:hypothetical protein